jgi:ribonuclease BN (tRNA processing enzyme)
VPLWAPEETIARITAFSTELAETFDIETIEGGGVMDIGGAKVSLVDMKHSVQTCGVRVEHGGRALAYTADTGPGSDFSALAGDADVVLCEATFQDSDQPWWEGHMSASQAGRMSSEVGAARLVLTHLPPTRNHQLSLQEARNVCGSVAVELAEPGRTIEVTR